ncbi:AAA family ATPase [Streptomonospora salina]|uniref:MoxR-like ATPase n=1 Tax=Streptomonospora salina TaxID=104205 RepID=A0A841EAW3_9ACTN|nr:AAA family ATPase [Streptomonospora salina]MBB6000126.1 MoxR-like ATPase [Streptomonospora salina]
MAPPAPDTPEAPGRLSSGQLRSLVASFLAANTGFHTPTEIARALDRSAGAVGNALRRLAEDGRARPAPDRPMRYEATATTADAAPPETRAAPAPESGRRPARPEPITRPGGTPYHPRALAEAPDVEVLARLRTAGLCPLLYGPPGTGKTALVEAAHPDLITVAGDADTAVADLVGEYTQNPDGTFTFAHGPLVRAMREGRCLFVDDATLISPPVLAVLYPAMDGRGEITIKAHAAEVVTAQPGFHVVCGHNPGVHGAVLTDALASRLAAHIHVSTDYDLARHLGVDTRAVRAARNLAHQHDLGEIGWAPQLRELLAFARLAEVLGLEAALANLAGIAPDPDRDAVIEALQSAFGRTVTPLSLGRQL